MKALVYTGVEELIYRDEKDPVEKEGESILEVQASGICGSDMHAYHGKDERRVPPLILGHEVSGKIIKIDNKNNVAMVSYDFKKKQNTNDIVPLNAIIKIN